MKKDKLEQILKDIYAIDHSLKQHEAELRGLLERIMASRPDTELDEAFVARLKQEVLERAEELKAQPASKPGFVLVWPKLAYALGGAALVVVIAIPFLAGNEQTEKSQDRIVFNTGIESVDDRAFGRLSGSELYKPQADSPEGLGAGGGGQLTQPEKSADGKALDMGAARVMPRRVNYEFVYKGADFDLPEGELPVYKRNKQAGNAGALARELTSINTDLMDLDSFRDTAVRNLDLIEDREFGLSLNFNLPENVISINKHYEKWPNPYMDCQGDADCFEKNRLKPEDVPADSTLVSLANDFLDAYGVDRSYYGSPEVQDSWRRSLDRAEEAGNIYVPDEISIVYPLVLNGQTVYGQSGEPNGLMVNVDIRHKRVAGAYPIMAYNFQSSAYPAVSEQPQVVELAEKGGLQPYFNHEDPTETITVELGTPELALFKYYNRDEDKNSTEELYVPAYIFPVENVSDDSSYFFREAIVVPAVEDLVDIEDRGGPIGIPEPRPMPVEPDSGIGDGAGPPPDLDSEEAGQAEPGSAGEGGIGIQIEE